MASRDAAGATQTSAKAVEKQVGVMERQTKATEDAAIAARDGADAANKNVEMFINKERARLRVDLKPLSLIRKHDSVCTVDFNVSIYGATDAFIVETRCAAYVLPLANIGSPEAADAQMFPIYSLPNVIAPNTSPLEQYAFLFLEREGHAENFFLTEIREGRWFVELRGFIKYGDVFNRDRVIRFRYIWKYLSSMGGMYGLGGDAGNWEKCGTETDNYET